MLSLRLRLCASLFFFALATCAPAQDAQDMHSDPGDVPRGFEQTVYKGLVGNVLDSIPMDPSKRLDLQRTNAVLGNTLLGRSLALLAGLTNPILLVGGFVWGVWAASNIKPAEAGVTRAADRGPFGTAAVQEGIVAIVERSSAAAATAPGNAPERTLVSSLSNGDPVDAAPLHHQVIKIWLPQRPSMP